MANKKKRQIGKNQPTKKHRNNSKNQNNIITAIIVIILLVFFIINNTRDVPNKGPYPPDFKAKTTKKLDF